MIGMFCYCRVYLAVEDHGAVADNLRQCRTSDSAQILFGFLFGRWISYIGMILDASLALRV